MYHFVFLVLTSPLFLCMRRLICPSLRSDFLRINDPETWSIDPVQDNMGRRNFLVAKFKALRLRDPNVSIFLPEAVVYVALWMFVNLVSLQSWVVVKATRSVHRRSTKKCSKQFDWARSRVLKSVETVLHTGQQQNLTSYDRCTTRHIYSIYLEPKWPLFLKVFSPQNKAQTSIKTRGPIKGFQVLGHTGQRFSSRMNG